jgi:polar amino acid transport system substrate-binding protein
MRSHPRLAPLTTPLLALALALAGCGGGTSPGSTPTAPPAPTGSVDPTLHDALPAAVKQSGVLRFAGDAHPPWRTIGPDGRTVTGIDVEVQQALGTVLGVRTEISIVDSLPSALTGMLSGRYDAFNGPVRDTAEREKDFDAISYLVTRTAYLVPKDNSSVRSTADLCGRKVAGVTGSITQDQARKLADWCGRNGKGPVEFVGLADTNAIILAAKAGRADAAGMTESDAGIHTKEDDTFTFVSQTEEQGAGADPLALLVPKSGALGPVMHKAFEVIFANGEYRKILDRHGLTRVAVPEPGYNVATAK